MDVQEGGEIAFEWRDAPKAAYAVVGDPVGHSLAPKMYGAAFNALGMDDTYVKVRVPKEEFNDAIQHLQKQGFKGLNVTVPLKEKAFLWALDKPRAESRMGVVNTLRLDGRAAINTDAPGFVDTLRDLGVGLPCAVLVLGAGGTTRSLAVALDDLGCELRCWNRTRTNLERMLHEVGVRAQILGQPDPTDCRLILNTTSASMKGAHIDVDWYSAPRTALAYDVFYSKEPTVFVKDALSNGIKAVDGIAMLVAQGARSFEWWTGKKPPKEDMLRAVQ